MVCVNILVKVYEIIVHFTLDAVTEFYDTPCIQEFPVSLTSNYNIVLAKELCCLFLFLDAYQPEINRNNYC